MKGVERSYKGSIKELYKNYRKPLPPLWWWEGGYTILGGRGGANRTAHNNTYIYIYNYMSVPIDDGNLHEFPNSSPEDRDAVLQKLGLDRSPVGRLPKPQQAPGVANQGSCQAYDKSNSLTGWKAKTIE